MCSSDLQQSVADLNWATNGAQSQAGWEATIKFNISTKTVKTDAKMTEGQDWTNAYYSG